MSDLADNITRHHVALVRQAQKGVPPKDLSALILWAVEEWSAEVPDELHTSGVWRDKEGASALGTPQTSPAARRYVEESDRITDADKFDPNDPEAAYAKPMRAVLRGIHPAYDGTPTGSDRRWYHANFLYELAQANFDWRSYCEQRMIPYPIAPIYTEWALRLWWNRYERKPRTY